MNGSVQYSDDILNAVRNVQLNAAWILEHSDATMHVEVFRLLKSVTVLMQVRHHIMAGVEGIDVRLRLDIANQKLDQIFTGQYQIRPTVWEAITRLESEIEQAKSLRF